MPTSTKDLHTSYGDFSDEVVVDVDGVARRVTIYHQHINDVWSEYTAVLDDGTVISRNRSLRQLLLDDADEVEGVAPVSVRS